jgi:oligopeptidase A
MENFCWEWDVVAPMTRHVDTGERIPRALFDSCSRRRISRAAWQFVRQLEFALFDMRCTRLRSRARQRARAAREVRARSAWSAPDYNRFPNQFSHIFAGGYAAGYYSYKWAEVLSADAYGAFEEAACSTRRSARASAARCWRRRQPPGARILRRVPRPQAADRRASCGIMG